MGIEPMLEGRDKRVRANKFGKEKEEESKTSDLTKVNFLKWREVDEEQICFVLTFFFGQFVDETIVILRVYFSD